MKVMRVGGLAAFLICAVALFLLGRVSSAPAASPIYDVVRMPPTATATDLASVLNSEARKGYRYVSSSYGEQLAIFVKE
jgi:hypothetical protein